MSDFITQSEIEHMTEEQLHAKHAELFNALAQKQQVMEKIELALQRIQAALSACR